LDETTAASFSPAPAASAVGVPSVVPAPVETFAALDLGTNNCRLLIARRAGGGGFRVVDAFSRIVRLGEGLTASGRLSEAAMARTIAALGICRSKLAQRRVTSGRYVATEACRRADNCAAFVERVREDIGIALEIISTEEEARLAVAGCAGLLDPQIPYAVVFDIGGGSTELVWLRQETRGGRLRRDVLGFVSLPHGVVSLTERHGGCPGGRPGDDVTPAGYAAMIAEVAPTVAAFEARHGIARRVRAGEVQMLGTSGTVTTLAGLHLDLPRYNRNVVDGSRLGFDEIRAITRRLAGMDLAARARLPCIGAERADLVVAGCAILEAICDAWPVGRLRVADRGVREGILIGLAAGAA
jgi:exopolyphosphatase / guanosine-5'-triphosphate,3'-diphosphate pyrophosphatase